MPIVLIATGFTAKSDNPKTGPMIQTWILRTEELPTTAAAYGHDVSICGGCPLKGIPDLRKRRCYVRLDQAPNAIWKCWDRGGYAPLSRFDTSLHQGKGWRLGAYGDPAAVPIEVWDHLFKIFSPSFHTGYTHQWRSPRLNDVLKYCQASVDTYDEARSLPQNQGYFRVLSPINPEYRSMNRSLPGETLCPASKEAGFSATCATCQLCDGKSGNRVAIYAHGAMRGQV